MKRGDEHSINLERKIEFQGIETERQVLDTLDDWKKENKIARLWNKDASTWTNHDEDQWTGWLGVVALEQNEIQHIVNFVNEIKLEDIQTLVLVGMGGSSLCANMLAKIFGKMENKPMLYVLDSTNPMQIFHLEQALDLVKTIFIVSSKSGKTLETNIIQKYFYERVQQAIGHTKVGNHFVAITDRGSSLDAAAKTNQFRATFYGVPSIGGRYSALSNFGMVPASLLGIDLGAFLGYAEEMTQACSATVLQKENTGLLLGIILGICAKKGQNKVTLILSPDISGLGDWLEQLLAESTGKQGRGLIPIHQESLGHPDIYGKDRIFVYIRLAASSDDKQDRAVAHLVQAGHSVVRCFLSEKIHLGATLFCWEIATAVAGSILEVNPFDQPDIETSKIRTLALIADYQKTRKTNQLTTLYSHDDVEIFADEANAQAIQEQCIAAPSLENFLHAHLSRINEGDYFAMLAFIEMSDKHFLQLQKSRMLIRDAKKTATCLNFGPQFLHSMGQIFKGGANSGVFIQITCDHDEDIMIPDAGDTFGFVSMMQAQADFEALCQRSRRIIRLHFKNNTFSGLQKFHEALILAMQKLLV